MAERRIFGDKSARGLGLVCNWYFVYHNNF